VRRRKTIRSIALGLLALMVVATGCATAGNTPAQVLAWERWEACNHFPTITLDRVDQDGRLVVTAYQVDGAPFTTCVREAAAAQVHRGAAAMPQVIVLVKNQECQGGAM
jgi:hypothetical protein